MIQTTIGQLNFFKWALDNKILEYIYEHIKEIVVLVSSQSCQISLIIQSLTLDLLDPKEISSESLSQRELSYSSVIKRGIREKTKMKLFLLMLFLLSNAQEVPVCGKNEVFTVCSNHCFESNCDDYLQETNFCPDCEC